MGLQHSQSKLGVILLNLGTPSEPTPSGVRKFLAEFLGDRRVVEIPRLVWWPILYGIILPFRSPKVAKLYQQIWQPGGSPLKVITELQVAGLQGRFADSEVQVTYAMTYGGPTLSQQIDSLEKNGCGQIVVLPLYPQYSGTTTGAVYDQCARLALQQRNVSDVRIHKSYYQHEDYIQALVESIQAHWAENVPADKLLFSFHGIPKRCVEKGDPYEEHCRYTAEAVVKRLGLDGSKWGMSFQSRLGKAEWLQPYTDQLLETWAAQGVKSVDVLCPAFAADCLETLEEIDGENRELFISAGGQRFEYIPCLNDSPRHLDLLAAIVEEYR